jgi:hypothetical protein
MTIIMIIIIIHFFHYLCAGTTATRPITETAQEHTKSTQTQATNENTLKRNNKSHIKIMALLAL